MIRYSLTCPNAHQFDSWFKSSAAYDALMASGLVTCAICGSAEVSKELMAPAVRPAKNRAAPQETRLSQPEGEAEKALAALRAQIEANSEYVGLNFVTEARKMHDGMAPERPIFGEAKLEDARKLIEDGVPVAPLPFVPKRKTN
jgi:hypothetical protein